MKEGSGMQKFADMFPERFFDVGIAEQHAVTFAGGLACDGIKPVVAIYSTFLQRAYDQLIHDVALQNLNVMFAIDRAGLVGADGATHAGAYDLSYLRCIPNMVVMAPKDELECCQMLNTGIRFAGPSAVRYPRGQGPGIEVVQPAKAGVLELGKAEVLRSCSAGPDKSRVGSVKKVAILAFGSMVMPSLEAGEKIDATVVNMRFVKPIDEAIILKCAIEHDLIVTVEENVIAGGAGSACAEVLSTQPDTMVKKLAYVSYTIWVYRTNILIMVIQKSYCVYKG